MSFLTKEILMVTNTAKNMHKVKKYIKISLHFVVKHLETMDQQI